MKKSTMMIWAGVLVVAGVVMQSIAAVPGSITAHVPGTMNYQGRLVGATGYPYVDGTYTFDIRLYKDANGGTPLWGGTYASYANQGYFNIMLGGIGGQAISGTTYTHTDLWKALWPDAANGAVGSPLYLGITPYKDAGGYEIPPGSRVELTPRQTLLTAPYAFRAQTAEYANRASLDFTVGGRISGGHITTPNNLLYTVGTTVNVGGIDNNIAANSVNINAKGVDIDAGSDDLWIKSSDRIDIGATGVIYMDGSSWITVRAQSSLELESVNGPTYINGKAGVVISSSAGVVNLNPATEVWGHGALKWTVPGATFPSSPMELRKVDLSFAANFNTANYETTYKYDEVSIMIVGLVNGGATITQFYVVKNTQTGNWRITLTRVNAATVVTASVDILVITKNWVNEQR